MRGQKLSDAKAATNFLVGELIAQDLAAVVDWNSFASTATGGLINEFTAVTSAVNGLRASGGTDLNAGLGVAVNILTKQQRLLWKRQSDCLSNRRSG